MNDPESINLAWLAAHEANDAHTRLTQAERGIEALQIVGGLSLEGLIIPDSAMPTLEERRLEASRAFAAALETAGPIMFHPDSPFTVQDPEQSTEEVVLDFIAYNNTARTRAEFEAFAEWRGYPGIAASALFGYLWKGVKRVGHVVTSSLEEYESSVTAVSPTALTAIDARSSRITLPYEPKDYEAIDIRTLYVSVMNWLDTGYSGIRGLNDRNVSVLADYLNHALPGIEPLPVAFPPGQRSSSMPAERLPADSLWLETAEAGGQESQFVSHRSVREFALSLGLASQRVTNLASLFTSLAHLIDPSTDTPRLNRHPDTNDLVFIGRRRTTSASVMRDTWGIAPDRFVALIEEIEASYEARQQINGYNSSVQDVVLQYVHKLRQFLAQRPPQQ